MIVDEFAIKKERVNHPPQSYSRPELVRTHYNATAKHVKQIAAVCHERKSQKVLYQDIGYKSSKTSVTLLAEIRHDETMPWNTKSQQRMKKEFIRPVIRKEVSMSEACMLYGISRRTGYKWLHRYEEQGEKGLEEISRKPHNQTTKLNEDIICRIVELRTAHRSWGVDKIQAVLKGRVKVPYPAEVQSTAFSLKVRWSKESEKGE